MIDNSFLSESPYYLCLSGFQRQRGQIVPSHRQFLLHEFESGRCLLQITPYLDDLIWKKIKKDALKVFFFFWKSLIIFVCLAVWTNCAILTDNYCSINLEVGRCLLQIHNNTLYHSMFQWCILQKKSREMMIPSCKDKCAQIAMIKSTWFRQSLVSIKYFPKNSNIDTKTHTSRETIIGIDYKMTWNIFNHGQVLSEKKTVLVR